MEESLENPRVFEWESNMLSLHATLEQKLSGELTHLWIPISSLSTYWTWPQSQSVMLRAMQSSTNPSFPIYLLGTPLLSLFLGPAWTGGYYTLLGMIFLNIHVQIFHGQDPSDSDLYDFPNAISAILEDL